MKLPSRILICVPFVAILALVVMQIFWPDTPPVRSESKPVPTATSWRIWADDGEELIKVQDGPCAIYILRAPYSLHVAMATGQGCK